MPSTTPKPGPPVEAAPVAVPVISEGMRQELLVSGVAADPLTGRQIILDDAGQPKFKD